MADVLADTGTREFADGAAGVGRTALDDGTSLHCGWAARTGAATKQGKRAKLLHIVSVKRGGLGVKTRKDGGGGRGLDGHGAGWGIIAASPARAAWTALGSDFGWVTAASDASSLLHVLAGGRITFA